MAKGAEQSISISEFVELCAGTHFKVQRAVEGWIAETDKTRVRERAIIGGGTDISLPREDVRELFRLGIIAIDPDKITTTHFRKKLDALKEKHGLTDEDLGLKPKRSV